MFEHVKSAAPLKLGYLPTHRWAVFSIEAAKAQKSAIERKLRALSVDFVGLDGLNKHGLLYDPADADAVVDRFRKERVDAVFAAHCDFGTEVAVGRVCKALNKPILLYGPRDEAPAPDRARERDTQCGLFATSKLLRRLGLPFTYVVNCRLEDAVFARGLDVFLRAANVARSVRSARIGQIDTRPAPFTSTMFNESELLERFDVQVIPTALSDITEHVEARLESEDVAAEAAAIRARVDASALTDDGLCRVASLKLVLMDWVRQNRLDAVAIQCWPTLQDLISVCSCFVDGELTDLGVPVACETDVNGAVTALALQAAARGESATFFADLTIRHPEDDNAELLWHCGPFPLSLAHPDSRPCITGHYMQAGRSPAVGMWRLKDGDITIGRFDGDRGEYRFLVGHARTCSGPATPGNYVWARVRNWPLWEERLIYGPYIHHVVGVYGKLAPALYEGLKYLGVQPELIEPTQDEVRAYLRGQKDL
jgi:L-fucose isomerase-like protein